MRLKIRRSTMIEIYSGMARLISRSTQGVQIRSTPGRIRACGTDHCNHLIYENEVPENIEGEGTIVLPPEDLKEILTTQGLDTTISFSVNEQGVATSEWECHGLKRTHLFRIHSESTEAEVPEEQSFKSLDSGRFQAEYLRCAQCTSTERARYDLVCIALDGENGRMMATDGRQFYQATGISFPWTDTCYLPVTEHFPEKVLFFGSDLRVARTKDSLAFRAGPWTHMAHLRDASFPPVEKLNPDIGDTELLLLISDEDAERLQQFLPQLPGNQAECRQVWLEADAGLTFRSTVTHQNGTSEGRFKLVSSHWIGGPSEICFNREYLLRGLSHGHRTFRFVKDNGPILAESEQCSYLFLPVTLKDEEAEKGEETKKRKRTSPAAVRKARMTWLRREALWLATELAEDLGYITPPCTPSRFEQIRLQMKSVLERFADLTDKRRKQLTLEELLPPEQTPHWEEIGDFSRADGTAVTMVRSEDGFFAIRSGKVIDLTASDVSGVIEPLLSHLWKPCCLALYYNGQRWWIDAEHTISRNGTKAYRRLLVGEPRPASREHLLWEIGLHQKLIAEYGELLPAASKERSERRLTKLEAWLNQSPPQTLDLLPLCFALPASA